MAIGIANKLREKDPYAQIPDLDRRVIPYGPPGPGGAQVSLQHHVSYCPHDKLWIDTADTETRSHAPKATAEEIVGSAYRVWTNLKRPGSDKPSSRHTEPAARHNRVIRSRFTQWKSVRDAIHGHDLEGLRELLESGEHNVNERGSDGFCAIHVAVKYGGAAFVELLLSKKASVDAQTEDGDTPLHHTAKTGSADIAKMLMDGGADASITNLRGWTALKLATFNGYKAVCAVIMGHPLEVHPRSTGMWPQQALGQQHPMATAELTPATITFPGVEADAGESAESKHKHKHQAEEEEVEPTKPSALGNIACQAEVNQRADAPAHLAIPKESKGSVPKVQPKTGPGNPSSNRCYVINYAQPGQFWREDQRKKAEAQKNAFWFKYSI